MREPENLLGFFTGFDGLLLQLLDEVEEESEERPLLLLNQLLRKRADFSLGKSEQNELRLSVERRFSSSAPLGRLRLESEGCVVVETILVREMKWWVLNLKSILSVEDRSTI